MAIVGDGVGGWPGDAGNPGPNDINQMGTTDGETWSINNLTLTEGSMKFRGNNSWDLPYNWGGTDFPSETGVVDGAGITSTAGVYNVTFNSTTLVYIFEEVSSGLMSVAIVGDGAGGWPGDPTNPGPEDINQMNSSDGINWTIENVVLTIGSAKFRGNNAWDLPYNWGVTDFPSGTVVVDSQNNIPTTAGTYDVTFNSDTFAYSFSETLSLEESDFSNFMTYPNPTKDVVHITSNKVISIIELFDLTGKKVMEIKNQSVNELRVSSLLTGIYMLRIVDTEGNVAVKKVIKN